jgi:hypothetical protein
MSMVRRLSVVAALGLSLAACGNSPSGNSAATTSSTAHGATTSFPEKVSNQVGVRKDVDLRNCASTHGGWSAGGTVRNTLGHDATYEITVFFTSSMAQDLAYATTSVPVSAGKSSLWSVTASFAAPSTVLCVLRGVSTS